MLRGSPKINHLTFIDDMIILCKVELRTIQLVAESLHKYKEISGQKVNKEKSAIYLHHNVHQVELVVIEVALGILSKEFPFNYLGCLIFYKRKQKLYYQQLIQRIRIKMQGWKGKLLSYGGKSHFDQTCTSEYTHSLFASNEPTKRSFKPHTKDDVTVLLE